MSTTDHYAEAEFLLEKSNTVDMDGGWAALVAAQAQVHATLATVQRGVSVGTLSVDLAPADSPGYLSIPWPPSDELVERVARTIAALGGRPWDALHPIRQDDHRAKARAVLDEIGGDA